MPPEVYRPNGKITAQDGARKEGGQAVFDRFGVLSYLRGGHYVEIFLDDVVYTAERP